MKVKAVIFKKNRTLGIHILTNKEVNFNRINVKDKEYLITNKDNFIITNKWYGPIKRSYITYYFKEDSVQPLDIPNFSEVPQSPISPEELAELFNPAFYRMVRGREKNLKQDMMMILLYVAAIGGGYAAYRSHQIWGLIKPQAGAIINFVGNLNLW